MARRTEQGANLWPERKHAVDLGWDGVSPGDNFVVLHPDIRSAEITEASAKSCHAQVNGLLFENETVEVNLIHF